MAKRIVAVTILCLFALGTLSACAPPGQLKKVLPPGQYKKHK